MKKFLFALLALLCPVAAAAQTVTGPTVLAFSHPPAEFNLTASYHLDFFLCASLGVNGVCVGRAAAPFNTGVDVLKSAVVNGVNERTISLTAPPASGVLPSLPTGSAFVATLEAIGDPLAGASGRSPRSADSNSFFARSQTPAAASALLFR